MSTSQSLFRSTMAAHVRWLFHALMLLCVLSTGIAYAQTATTTTLTANPTSVAIGGNVLLTASVTGASTTPSGNVTIMDGSTVLFTVMLAGGSAAGNTQLLGAGNHNFTASYAGDANNTASTSAVVQVTATQATSTTTFSLPLSTATTNVPFVLNVSVSGYLPTGSVSFTDGSTTLGTATLSGSSYASLSTTFASVSTHSITAVYSGDTNNTPSTVSLVLAVNPPQDLFEYDPNGNLTRSTNANGAATEQSFDLFGRLTQTRQPDPDPAATTTLGAIYYAYDGLDQIKTLTDPRNLVTTYTTDGLGNTSQIVSPDTGTTSYTYDIAGNPLTRTNAKGQVTTYTWGPMNRPNSIDYGDTRLDFSYGTSGNAAGHLTQLTTTPQGGAANTALSWDYDDLEHIGARHQSLVLPAGSSAITLNTAYTWNPITNNLSSLTLPSGHVIGYTYDATGQLIGINLDGQALIANLTYTPFGALASWSAGSRQYTRSYDLNGRPTTLPLGDAQRALTWDYASRITQIQDTPLTGSVLTRSLGYDRLDRVLIQDITSATPQHYSYTWDLVGNRSTYSYNNGTSTWSYTYTTANASNQLNQIAGSNAAAGTTLNYQYDAAGNPSTDTSNTYTWANNGTLASVTHASQTTQYRYNGLNQRVAKIGSDTRLFTYDEAGHLIGEYNAAGQAIQEHLWLGDTPMAVIDTDGAKFVFVDQLNTPRAITNASGTVLWKWDGEAFGLSQPNEDVDGDGKALSYNLRFPGQYFDKESNLHYNFYRYYDPATGRYISSDPIGLEGGINTYAYVAGNPVGKVDFFGLCSCDRILDAAEKLSNNEGYGYHGNLGPGPETNKCNAFVSDVLRVTGLTPRRHAGLWGSITAGTWADPNADIPNFPVVTDPQPGDIVAVAHAYADASGHVAIVKEPGKSTIGAGTYGSHVTGWPWDTSLPPRGTPVYRRCTCTAFEFAPLN